MEEASYSEMLVICTYLYDVIFQSMEIFFGICRCCWCWWWLWVTLLPATPICIYSLDSC